MFGGAARAALPLVTAGFYSKDEILWEALASGNEPLLWAGLVGAFLTSIYTFRLIFIAFHGEAKTDAHAGHGISHYLPLGVLLVLSTGIGALIHPPLAGVLPGSAGEMAVQAGSDQKHQVAMISGVVAIIGIAIAAWLFLGERKLVTAIANSAVGRFFHGWWQAAWGFDWLYDLLFVRPFRFIARPGRSDGVDNTAQLGATLAVQLNTLLVASQNGKLRWYAALIGLGVVLCITGLAIA